MSGKISGRSDIFDRDSDSKPAAVEVVGWSWPAILRRSVSRVGTGTEANTYGRYCLLHHLLRRADVVLPVRFRRSVRRVFGCW
jgi:hypothetical protein